MKKLTLALAFVVGVFLFAVLSGCGYQGNFRYPCQDPANWELEECKPPICNASDTCTTDLLPEEMTVDTVATNEP